VTFRTLKHSLHVLVCTLSSEFIALIVLYSYYIVYTCPLHQLISLSYNVVLHDMVVLHQLDFC